MSIDLGALGWDAERSRQFRAYARAGCRPARVSRVDRGAYPVLAAAGPARASAAGRLLADAARDLLRLPVTGDWVALRDWPDHRLTVEAVLPRRTCVVRAGAGRDSQGQLLAANVDTAAVVEPLDPTPDPGRIERLLTLVWRSGAEPVVVLTKADRVPRAEALADQLRAVAPGVAMFAVCATDPATLAPLRERLAPGRTVGLFGASGVGKSTLVNTLVGADVLTTRALRSDGKGRHTTTYRALVPVPDGGAVLDTPGLRLIGMAGPAGGAATGKADDPGGQGDPGRQADPDDGVDRAFGDIAALAAGCRFGDCRHDTEPGCAVRAAVTDGALSARRLASWRKLAAELRWQHDRSAARAAAAERSAYRRARARHRRGG